MILSAVFWVFAYKKDKNNFTSSGKKADISLINPTISANLGKHYIINFSPLKKELEIIRGKYAQKNYIYFLYLNNSSWVGFDEKELFTAASTVKVPVAISVLRFIENGRLKLNDVYTLDELDIDNGFGELYKGGVGKEFSVEELIKIMVEQSDNTALLALLHIFEDIGIINPLEDVYLSLGWDMAGFMPSFGQDAQPNYENINLKTLSNMFTALYNVAYLNEEHSQKLLSFLADTPFDEKMVRGIPSSVTVSHKIGIAAGGGKTFSDCGIVYIPKRHYILCLGSSGGDESSANQFMAEVSKAVYQYVIDN
ncbi:MAG: beta-lactamase class A [Parcubacteria group bacterium Licking1014_17]|nr:MAG: beta-lactamase class A [Parcubacteria group bacterium Licking1014_17]